MKFDTLHRTSPESEALKEYRERVIEKEINVACGKSSCRSGGRNF